VDACANAATVHEVAQRLRVQHKEARWLLRHYDLHAGAGAGGDATRPRHG
jgi:hypothetical protein